MKKRLTKDKIMNMSTYTLVTVAFVILQLLMSQGKLSSTMKGLSGTCLRLHRAGNFPEPAGRHLR